MALTASTRKETTAQRAKTCSSQFLELPECASCSRPLLDVASASSSCAFVKVSGPATVSLRPRCVLVCSAHRSGAQLCMQGSYPGLHSSTACSAYMRAGCTVRWCTTEFAHAHSCCTCRPASQGSSAALGLSSRLCAHARLPPTVGFPDNSNAFMESGLTTMTCYIT